MCNCQVSDSMLVERYQRGDRDSLNILLGRHQEPAYKYALRLARDPDVAADVVADSFTRVSQSAKSFKGQSAFSTWLYRIITNCFLDRRQKAQSRQTVSIHAMLEDDDCHGDWRFASKQESPYEVVERNERDSILGESVVHLPEYQRIILTMYHVELLTYKEISDILTMPIGTVKSRLSRARNGLRIILEGQTHMFQPAVGFA